MSLEEVNALIEEGAEYVEVGSEDWKAIVCPMPMSERFADLPHAYSGPAVGYKGATIILGEPETKPRRL